MNEKPTYEELEYEIKRLNETIKKNETDIIEIQELAKIGNWEWNVKQQTLTWSDEVYRIFGLKPNIFKPSAEAFEATIHPDDREEFLRQREIMLNETNRACIDHRIVLPDGSVRYVQERAQVILNNQKEICRVIGTVQDITDRKKTEAALKKSEEKYRFLANNVSDMIWIMDMNFNYTYVSPSITRMLGFTVEEGLARTVEESITPSSFNDAMKVLAEELELNTKGQAPLDRSIKIENEIFCKDGSTVWTEAEVSFIFDSKGQAEGVIGVTRDITERKKAEKFLKESELKHKTLVNNIPGMVYRAYPDWSAEVFSGSESVSGYVEEELNSQVNKWLDIVHPDDKKRVIKDVSELIKGKKSTVQTYRIKAKSGNIRWIEDRKTSVFSEEGEFLGIDGVVFDITDRKRLEKELLEAKSALEEKVKERTSELNEKNITLKVLLEQGEEAKIHLEEVIMSNVKNLVMPNIARVKNSKLTTKQQTTLSILEANLNEIVFPFSKAIDSKFTKLTPTEIQVANHIKHGASSKEISESLALSQRTVDTHRYNIRKKLGIRGKDVNLRTYLSSMR